MIESGTHSPEDILRNLAEGGKLRETDFEVILQIIDSVHNPIALGKGIESVVEGMNGDELQSWLGDIAFTAKETIKELEGS